MKIIRLLLEAVRLDDTPQATPAKLQQQPPKPPATGSRQRARLERKKAVQIAANILSYERYHGDAFGRARTMTNDEIAALIARFRADAFGE